MVSAGHVERGRWIIKPEPQPLNVTNEIIQQMDVKFIINKLDEVIIVMNSFNIEVNLGNIHGAINQVAKQINFLEDEEKGYLKILKLLEDVQAKLKDSNEGIKLLSDKYAEMAKSIVTGNESLI